MIFWTWKLKCSFRPTLPSPGPWCEATSVKHWVTAVRLCFSRKMLSQTLRYLGKIAPQISKVLLCQPSGRPLDELFSFFFPQSNDSNTVHDQMSSAFEQMTRRVFGLATIYKHWKLWALSTISCSSLWDSEPNGHCSISSQFSWMFYILQDDSTDIGKQYIQMINGHSVLLWKGIFKSRIISGTNLWEFIMMRCAGCVFWRSYKGSR